MTEALELAKQFKDEGKYDLFRGQARDWEVVSSASRIGDNSAVIREMEEFCCFCEGNELLKAYINTQTHDELIAIAQHYSLKTNFIDFTSSPEIAMYFATHDDKSCVAGQDSVIVCLNRRDFENEVRDGFVNYSLSKQNLPIPSIIDVDLTNLWRLEAQKGCFLELQIVGFDKCLYGFDRIYFPYSEPFDGIREFDIYPERQSPIEIELNKFFTDVRMRENSKIIRNIPNLKPIVLHTESSTKISHKIFRAFPDSKHTSWISPDKKWENETKVEWKYQEHREILNVDVKQLMDPDAEYFNELVAQIALNRSKLIDINLTGVESSDTINSDKVKKLFDGMNILPYSNEQIACAIKALFDIELHFDEIANKIYVEFGERENGKGYYSRSYIFDDDYTNLLRDDIKDYVLPEIIEKMHSSPNIEKDIAQSILNLGCDIRFVSDFNKLVELFALRIIPFQTYLNRQPLLFNPTRIRIFGKA